MQGASISAIQHAMSTGELTAAALTAYYLERIQSKDTQLGAVIELNPAAAEIAAALDDERAAGGPLDQTPARAAVPAFH